MNETTPLGLAIEAFGSEDDRPIVFVHGIGQSRHVWRAAATALALAGRYAVIYDLRGHGDSQPSASGD